MDDENLDVRAIRIELDLTQAQLAHSLCVDQSTVSNWENGMSPRGPARKLIQNLLVEHRRSGQGPAQQERGAA